MKPADPAAMSPADRLAELAEILAAACQRFFANEIKRQFQPTNSQVRLDVLCAREAPCGSRVQSPQSKRPA